MIATDDTPIGNPPILEFHWSRVVLKKLRFFEEFDFVPKDFRSIHREASILETFTSSERFSDMYGHCATGILIQAAAELTERIIPYHRGYQFGQGSMKEDKLKEWQEENDQAVSHPDSTTSVLERSCS